MRILYINPATSIGGAETNLLNLLEYGPKFGVEPAAVLIPGDGSLKEEIESKGIPVGIVSYYGFKLPNPLRYFQTLLEMNFWVRRTKADVIHHNLQFLSHYTFRLGQISGKPTVCHVRSIDTNGYVIPPQRRWLSKMSRIVAISNAVKQDLVRYGIPAEKIVVVYDGINTGCFSGSSNDRSLRDAVSISDDITLVGLIGRLEREKGVLDFIEAARIVVGRGAKVRFIVVGQDSCGGQFEREVKHTCRRLGLQDHVSFLGFRKNIPQILRELDVFVLASWMEGLSDAVLEAMASRTLVVATKVGGVCEILQDGQTGILVSPHNPADLARGILDALNLPLERASAITSAAYEKVTRDFSMQRQVEHLRLLYSSLLRTEVRP